jgi:hypothetical protein
MLSGKFEIALNMSDLRGLFVANEAAEADYVALAQQISQKTDPFVDPVTLRPSTDQEEDRLRDWGLPSSSMERLSSKLKTQGVDFYFPYPSDTKTYLVSPDGDTVKRIKMIPEDVVKSLFLFPNLVYRHYDYFKFLVGSKLMPERAAFIDSLPENDIMGQVVLLTKDRKLKRRPIYNATVMAQLMAAPIHNWAKKMLKLIPNCYCFDQDAGIDWLAEQLAVGGTFTSLDISSSSDNIPLSVQIRMVENIFPETEFRNRIIDCWKSGCQAKWISPLNPNIYVRHRKGTPMGLVGSYYVFTLFLVNQFQKIGMGENDFGIVGDDIFIRHQYYEKVMRMFEFADIPISLGKSIVGSTDEAEFCGRRILKTGPLSYFKAKHYDPDNPLVVVRRLGFKGLAGHDKLEPVVVRRLKLALHKKQNNRVLKSLIMLPDENPPQWGGYTLMQYKRLKLLTLKEFKALEVLTAMLFSKEKWQPSFLDGKFRFERRVSCVMNGRIVKTIRMEEFILRDELPSLKWRVPTTSILHCDTDLPWASCNKEQDLSRLVQENYDLLYSELKRREIPELDHLQPQYNNWSTVRLVAEHQAAKAANLLRVKGDDTLPILTLPDSFVNGLYSSKAKDILKPMATVSLEDDDPSVSNAAGIDPNKVYDSKTLQSDLKEGQHHKKVMETLLPFWSVMSRSGPDTFTAEIEVSDKDPETKVVTRSMRTSSIWSSFYDTYRKTISKLFGYSK